MEGRLIKALVEKDGVGADHVLQYLVSLINGVGSASMGITLTIGGSLVTGLLISGDSFFEQFSSDLAGGFAKQDETTEKIRATLNRFGDKYRNDRISDEDVASPVYIHLKEAKIYAPGGIVPKQSLLWRGKVSSVDGFMLGITSTVS